MHRVTDRVAGRVRSAIHEPTEWQHIGNQIGTAHGLAWADFVNVNWHMLVNHLVQAEQAKSCRCCTDESRFPAARRPGPQSIHKTRRLRVVRFPLPTHWATHAWLSPPPTQRT